MDEFGLHTENESLRAVIVAEIATHARITFRRFMELALYHPRFGYYAASDEVIGRRGDYLTSPELSPLFGAMIGRQAAEVWRLLGCPADFTLVEAGPGNGTLARDLIRWAARAEPDLRAVLRYVMVERSAMHVARQRRLLAGEPGVMWMDVLPEGVTGCIFSNELLDAFPAHMICIRQGALHEAYVEYRDGAFVETWGPPSTDALGRTFEVAGVWPSEGARAEVNLDAPEWLTAAAGALVRGLILTLDYGYPAAQLYAPWRKQGTLMCFYRHTAGDDPLIRVGRQDITAHIDFSAVTRAGLDAGLTVAGFTTQRELLTALGIHDALRRPDQGADAEHVARYRAVSDLLESAGLGRVRALALTRGLGNVVLRGFPVETDARASLFRE